MRCLEVFPILLRGTSILRQKALVEILRVGETAADADVKQRVIGEQQKLSGMLTANFVDVSLEADAKRFLEKMR